MKQDKKNEEWILLNRAVLDIHEMCTFLLETEEELIKQKDSISIFEINHLTDLFYLFSNISKVSCITELGKIIDPDSNSINLYGFVGLYPKDSEVHIKFREWKRETKQIRETILNARNKFSAHTDRESFHRKEFFGLYFEDVNNFLSATFTFFDYLYNNDKILRLNFDQKICPAGPRGECPSKVASSWQRIMATRIKSLREKYNN